MSKKVEVKGIQVRLPSGKVIELTMEQARDLHEELNKLFGKSVEYHSYPVYVERRNWPWWNTPYYYSSPLKVDDAPEKTEIWCMDHTPHEIKTTGQITSGSIAAD